MSSSSKVSRKSLAFLTALATVMALAVPFVGTATAAHGTGRANDTTVDITQVTLTPETSTAPSGSCQVFTATATFNGQAAEGETLDIQAVVSDPDTTDDANISFCTPPTGTSSTLVGGGTSGGLDTFEAENNDAASTATTQEQIDIRGECTTDANGQCRFGIVINDTNANTTGVVTAFADLDQDGALDSNEPRDTSTISVGAGGAQAAENVTCSPATDTNPEGSLHQFQCTVTDAQGQALSGIQVAFDVTAGPNAEEVGPTNCGSTPAAAGGSNTGTSTGATQTNQQGQTAATGTANACGYTDATGTTSPPGTDTITAFVNQEGVAGQQTTTGADPGEPQTTISKTWVGGGNSISCTPDGAQANPGSTVLVTCVVTDVNSNPVQNATVTFTETGPGTLSSNTCTNTSAGGGQNANQTNAQGECTVSSTTAANETGTQTITGTLTNGNCAGTGGTGGPGTPNTGTTADCTDTATINWGQATVTPDPDPTVVDRQRNITLKIEHVFIKNRKGNRVRWIKASGQVSSPDFSSCAAEVPVKVQIKTGAGFLTRKSDTTTPGGRFAVIIADSPGLYRAVAPKVEIQDDNNNQIDRCLRAAAKKRHRH